jgi:Na+:H+ antiporter, NhaA family
MTNVPPRSRGTAVAQARTSFAARRIVLPAQAYFHTETIGGIVLLAATCIALVWANSRWAPTYEALWTSTSSLSLGPWTVIHSNREWVNDALMTVFFFVVGLEVKREFAHGELSGWRRASLPIICALGGMVVPAGMYLFWNAGLPSARGWGIPMATDIAFALGILALVGDRVSASARIFLLALATADDIGAIVVIALFYGHETSLAALATAGALVIFILLMRAAGVQSLLFYVIAGAIFWFATLESGIHATIAGVVLGLSTPTKPSLTTETYEKMAGPVLSGIRQALGRSDTSETESLLGEMEELTLGTEAPADRLIRLLHPWSAYVVLPIFALANAGIPLTMETFRLAAVSPVARGILAGLLAGKVAGILLFGFIALRAGIAQPVPGVNRRQMAGIGLLGGIGFTVSLFISSLAFDGPEESTAKLSILVASLLAGAAGYVVLRAGRNEPRPAASKSG